MARGPRPEPSDELLYLRKVIEQKQEADDPADNKLAFYRKLVNDNGQWVLTQKMAAEEKHRVELAAWKKAGKKETEAEQDDAPLEPCEVLVKRLLEEWQND